MYALAYANNSLFTAGQDTSIRVWQLNEQAGIFVSQVNAEGQCCGLVELCVQEDRIGVERYLSSASPGPT